MQAEPQAISEVLLLTPQRFADSRGFFSETSSQPSYAALGIPGPFVQDNHSRSVRRGTVRGLHLQVVPSVQGKLVRCVRGAIWDVAVDVRQGSPTYGRHAAAVLSAENWAQLWIPGEFLHGFCALEPDAEVIYKVTSGYDRAAERGVIWNDPDLALPWPLGGGRGAAVRQGRGTAAPAELPGVVHRMSIRLSHEYPEAARSRPRRQVGVAGRSEGGLIEKEGSMNDDGSVMQNLEVSPNNKATLSAVRPLLGALPFSAMARTYIKLPKDSEQVRDRCVLLDYGVLIDLLKVLADRVPVDEVWYRERYPDIDDGIRKGEFRSAKHHYVEFGYFEDRIPRHFEVNDQFYRATNPDIAQGIKSGTIASTQGHFEQYGFNEGRIPWDGWWLIG
ncbi:MAG TPA: dTDP-4-dehydrorhamnose 3,5-epimerase [Acidobacteriaceae bacterium]